MDGIEEEGGCCDGSKGFIWDFSGLDMSFSIIEEENGRIIRQANDWSTYELV